MARLFCPKITVQQNARDADFINNVKYLVKRDKMACMDIPNLQRRAISRHQLRLTPDGLSYYPLPRVPFFNPAARAKYKETLPNFVEIKPSDNKMPKDFTIVPMGFEYTYFLSKRQRPVSVDIEDSMQYADELDVYEEKLSKSRFAKGCSLIYIDGPCIEICTPVHQSKSEVLKFFKKMKSEATKLKLDARPTEMASGGLHINCAIPNNTNIKGLPRGFGNKFMRNLITDMANRPYLNWVFNDPMDTENANCLYGNHDAIKYINHVKYFHYTDIRTKDYAINVKDKNYFEFRIFDMVKTEYELSSLIDFVNAYMRYIYKITLAKKEIKKSPIITDVMIEKEIFLIQPEVAEDEFNKLIKKLGLNMRRYKRFLKNMHLRYKYAFAEIDIKYLK